MKATRLPVEFGKAQFARLRINALGQTPEQATANSKDALLPPIEAAGHIGRRLFDSSGTDPRRYRHSMFGR